MVLIRKTFLPFFVLFLAASCQTVYQPARLEFKEYRIAGGQDSALLRLIRPYSDSVNNSMNDVVGRAEQTLDKKQPEGTLGNFMVDALYASGQKVFNRPVDAAILNYGGIRITQLAGGPVTRGKIFELMPFDNLAVVQQLKGTVLQQFLDLIAGAGGWPVAGLTFQIADKKAVNVRIKGQPLDPNKVYTIITSDYIANGGDNAAMLKPVAQQTKGYLIRDALFDHIAALKAEGRQINAREENRVTHAQ